MTYVPASPPKGTWPNIDASVAISSFVDGDNHPSGGLVWIMFCAGHCGPEVDFLQSANRNNESRKT
jgi:hypothetical protein